MDRTGWEHRIAIWWAQVNVPIVWRIGSIKRRHSEPITPPVYPGPWWKEQMADYSLHFDQDGRR